MIRGATYGLSEAVKGFSYPKTVPTQSSAKIHMKKHQITGSQQQNKVVARNQLTRPCTWLTWQSKRTGQEGGHIIRRILVCCPCLSCGEVGCGCANSSSRLGAVAPFSMLG